MDTLLLNHMLKVMIWTLGGTSTQSRGETSRRRYFLARDSKGEFTHEETGKGWGKGIYRLGDGGWHGSLGLSISSTASVCHMFEKHHGTGSIVESGM